MNQQKLNELWDKAATASAAYPSGQNSSWETQVNFMEKFAELIVKECYEHCKGQRLDKEVADTNELTYNDAVMDCSNGLLQHFGVKE
jgi:hypothetical protein